MRAVLETRDLGRWYGQVVGLNDLSVEIPGGVTGLIGPNGAGKSTLLKLIVGELRPSRGSLAVLGQEPFANRDLFRRIGFSPQQDAFYSQLSGFAFVRLLLRLSGFGAREAGLEARRALERLGLGDAMHRRIAGYSKGMRQRTKIAQAIAHAPELLVLDEPLTGLDPIGRRDLLELFRELGDGGTHILISSHVLHEVERLTDEICLLVRGRLLAQGSVEGVRELLSHHPRRLSIVAREGRLLARELFGWEEVRQVRLEEETLEVETTDLGRFQERLTALLAQRSFGVRSLESADASLEAVFEYLVS